MTPLVGFTTCAVVLLSALRESRAGDTQALRLSCGMMRPEVPTGPGAKPTTQGRSPTVSRCLAPQIRRICVVRARNTMEKEGDTDTAGPRP